MTTIKSINLDKLSSEDQSLICDVINRCGSDEHPFASEGSLPYFADEYVRECIDKAMSKMTPAGVKKLTSIKELI